MDSPLIGHPVVVHDQSRQHHRNIIAPEPVPSERA
jgi:hypothetical protein